MIRALLVLCFVALAACQSAPTVPAEDLTTARNRVYQAKLAYAGYLKVAVAYNERPRCGRPTSPPLCSSQAVVDQARKADNAAVPALDAAESAVRTVSADQSVVEAAVLAAEKAVDALKAITAGAK